MNEIYFLTEHISGHRIGTLTFLRDSPFWFLCVTASDGGGFDSVFCWLSPSGAVPPPPPPLPPPPPPAPSSLNFSALRVYIYENTVGGTVREKKHPVRSRSGGGRNQEEEGLVDSWR